ncbi:aminomethyltransferase family protein [Parvibaculaceae bacterium PLY_AMNH_Bact1]|nr:aminomethyltransferase family protein [Parvibaculaceae bacterium PLY_AMNH_Bact1]
MTEEMTEQGMSEETMDVSRGSPLNGPGVAPDPAWFEQAADEPPYARHVLTTPLHLEAADESRTNSWTEWAGYTVANVYTSIEQEYDALRTRAGVSDISPLVKIRLSGREVSAYLDRLLTRPVGALEINHSMRAVLCDGNGCVIAEAVLFRLDDEEFRLVLRSSHMDWLMQSAQGFDVQLEDVSGTIAGLSLAGPLSDSVLTLAGVEKSGALAKHQGGWVELGGMPVYLSRTGMMGGLEYELWCDPADASVIWRRLLTVGQAVGLRPVGAAVRDIARLENGIALEGIDYRSAFTAIDASEALSPYDLCLGGCVDLERSVFNGQSALRKIADSGSTNALVGFELDLADIAVVGPICNGDKQVGHITSHAWSPTLQCTIALGLVEASALGASAGFSIKAQAGENVPAKLTKRPFLRFP